MTGDPGLRIGVLGPLQASRGGMPVRLPRGRTAVLLAVLAMSAGHPVGAGRLAGLIWPEGQPRQVRPSLHTLVARLRGAVPGTIVTAADGYLLDIDPDDVDLLRFRRLVREAGAGREPEAAAGLLDQALELWRGEPLADLRSAALSRDLVPGLVDERLAALQRRADLDLAAGRNDRVIALLREETGQYPLREPLWSQLIRALAGAGRPAEAIQQYHRAREILAGELGIDPSAELQELYRQLLQADRRGTPDEEPPGTPAPGPPRPWRPDAAAPGVPRQLPARVAGFTGRAGPLKVLSELADEAAADPGVVVISAVGGMAGIGKTALAVHWAHQAAARFPDGQLYADLRGFHPSGAPAPPADVIRGFLDGLEVPAARIPASAQAQAALYRTLLADRRVLVVLDNARDAAQVRPLLPGAAGCMVVVTSRGALAPLAAEFGARLVSLPVLTDGEAAELLSARLGRERTAAEPAAAAALTALCGQLPLALAITAARAAAEPELSLAALAAEIGSARQRLDALDAGDPMTSLRAALSWSSGQLTVHAADMFRLLDVHPGPDISLPAAASLAGVPLRRAAAALRELAGLHLLTQHRPGRYIMHDLVRAYAAEQAAAIPEGERAAAIRRVLDHYLHTAWAANLALSTSRAPLTLAPLSPRTGPEQLAGAGQIMDWFNAERQVLLAAVELAAGRGLDTHAWQLPWSLASYLDRQGHWQDWAAAQRTALAAAQRLGDQGAQALIRHSAGRAGLRLGAFAQAREHFEAELSLHASRGDRAGQARAHSDLAMSYQGEERREDARAHSEQALALFRATGDQPGQADALNKIGWLAAQAGDYQHALACCEEALGLLHDLDRRYEMAFVRDSLGYIHRLAGDHAQAISCYRQAAAMFAEVADRYEQSVTLTSLGDTCHAAGQPGPAHDAWQQALALLDDLGHPDADALRARLPRPGGRLSPGVPRG
jgi:DNA-binding SARP family transcriptional activator/Tfp pilus assembly protein PilF